MTGQEADYEREERLAIQGNTLDHGDDLPKMRSLPADLEVEASLLSSCFAASDWSTFQTVSSIVSGDDFFSEAHRFIFQELAELSTRAGSPDMTLIAAGLKAKGRLAKVRAASLRELVLFPISSDIEATARKVRLLSLRREAIRAAQEIVSTGYDWQGDDQEWIEESATKMQTIAQSVQRGRSVSNLLDAFRKLWGQISDARAGADLSLSSGLDDLDALHKLRIGELTILAGRPAMGKSGLGVQWAHHIALTPKTYEQPCVLFFSVEMPEETAALRLLAAETGMNSRNIQAGFLDDVLFDQAADRIATPLFRIDDDPNVSLAKIRAKIRQVQNDFSRMVCEGGRPCVLRCVVLDYLQLVESSNKKSNTTREQVIAEISRGLKIIAKEFQVAVLALSQVNRSVESRDNKRPLMSDLRESGAVEQDADAILFVYRDEYYNPDSPLKGICEVIVSKARGGKRGTAILGFNAELVKFRTLPVEQIPVIVPAAPTKKKRRSNWEPRGGGEE